MDQPDTTQPPTAPWYRRLTRVQPQTLIEALRLLATAAATAAQLLQ